MKYFTYGPNHNIVEFSNYDLEVYDEESEMEDNRVKPKPIKRT